MADAACIGQLHADGLRAWENALAGGLSRGEVAAEIATSPEAQGDLVPTFAAGVFVPDASDAAVARLYDGLLGRAPDGGGLAGWGCTKPQQARCIGRNAERGGVEADDREQTSGTQCPQALGEIETLGGTWKLGKPQRLGRLVPEFPLG